MADALLTLLDRVRLAYDELHGTEEEAVDQGFARGIYHARLEGFREGILSGLEQQAGLKF